MALKNKLGITDSAELARTEEKIGKTKALELFEIGLLNTFEIGTFAGLQRSTSIYLVKSTISPEKCGWITFQRAVSGLPR